MLLGALMKRNHDLRESRTAVKERRRTSRLLIEKPVSRGMKDYKKVRKLLKKSFSSADLFPFWALNLMAARPSVDYTAYYYGGRLCGVSYAISNSRLFYVLYLAVEESVRGEGFGTIIVRRLLQKAGSRELVLDVEAPNRPARNAREREERIEFYEKNGITDTGWDLVEETRRYRILSSRGRSFDRGDLYRLIWRFTLGYNQIKTEKHR